jgi:hypothetical protein
VRRADNITTFICRLSRNLGASASQKSQDLSRPAQGLLYLDKSGFSTMIILLYCKTYAEVLNVNEGYCTTLGQLSVSSTWLANCDIRQTIPYVEGQL